MRSGCSKMRTSPRRLGRRLGLGADYVRLSDATSQERLREALERIGKMIRR